VEEFRFLEASTPAIITLIAKNTDGSDATNATWTGIGAEKCTGERAVCLVMLDPTNTNPPTIKATLPLGCAAPPIKIGNLEVQPCDYQDSAGNYYFNWADAITVAQTYGPGWHLPTQDELFVLYLNKSVLGTLGAGNAAHWSSTEDGSGGAWYLGINTAEQLHGPKSFYNRVRAVRAF
jgi:hypothetical protein